MRDLTQQTLDNLAQRLPEIYAEQSAMGVANKAMELVNDLIPVTIATTAAFQQQNDGQLACELYDVGPMKRTPQEIAHWTGIALELADENPLLKMPFDVLVRRTIRAGDLIPDREFFQTAMFKELFLPCRGYRQLIVTVPMPGGWIWFGAYRDGKDFNDAEFAIVDFLRPHLNKLTLRGAQKQEENLAIAALRAGSGSQTVGIVSLNAISLRVLTSNLQADRLLSQAGLQIHSRRMPDLIERWVAIQRNPNRWIQIGPPDDLRISAGKSTLEIRMIHDIEASTIHLIVLGGKTAEEPSRFQALGLTERESDVLHWFSKGKSSSDVAGILSISPRTVDKHAERILAKLGVETRLSAVADAHRRLA